MDLRDWMAEIAARNELARLSGVATELEMGALTDVARKLERPRALHFADIPGYPKNYGVLTNSLGSLNRFALAVSLPAGLTKAELLRLWSEKIHENKRIQPNILETGPIFENVHPPEELDINEFPAPQWHQKDGGRYIGTAAATITRGMQDKWINVGCYRVVVVDKNHLAMHISPGKHGRLHWQEYFRAGESCPVAISLGHHPVVFLAATASFLHTTDSEEYAWAAGLLGKPLDLVLTKKYGLPVPAAAEIVVEGKFLHNQTIKEGPFGEWTGYYAHSIREAPLIEIEMIYHRNDPIILGHPPGKARGATDIFRILTQAAQIKEAMKGAGVPGVKEVWCLEPGGGRFFIAVSIEQMYPGHARQAGLIASQCGPGAYMNKYVVVVDPDIDVTDMEDVLWAMSTRSDPERSIEIIKRCRSGPLDPAIPLMDKGLNSRAIIDCCRPFEWRDQFPEVIETSQELIAKVTSAWGGQLEV